MIAAQPIHFDVWPIIWGTLVPLTFALLALRILFVLVARWTEKKIAERIQKKREVLKKTRHRA
jgi:hypothetical protein